METCSQGRAILVTNELFFMCKINALYYSVKSLIWENDKWRRQLHEKLLRFKTAQPKADYWTP